MIKNYKYDPIKGKLIDPNKVKDKSKLDSPALIDWELDALEAEAIIAMQVAERRDEDKKRYYCPNSLDVYSDKNNELICEAHNPEDILIRAEEVSQGMSQADKLVEVMKSLTLEQYELVKMLKSGMSVTAIAEKLGVTKSAVSNMRVRIQEKIKKLLS